jgi:ADP-ribose pyrophosphatase YjhB (NUDIX family)
MNILDIYLEKIQYTPGDLVSKHDAISAIIMKDNKILMLDHVKYDLWTIPIGKVDEGKSVEDGLKQEMKEELNIIPVKFKKITIFSKSYMREGHKVTITNHMFEISDWRGSLRNNEPKKHRSIKFMSLDEIRKLKKISDSTKEMLKVL